MFGKMNEMRGEVRLEVSGDMPERFLNGCAAMGLSVISARRIDAFSVSLTMPASQLEAAQAAALKCCCELKIIKEVGGRFWGRILRRRIIPAVLAALCVALLFWSKFYVWEIEVSGNETVPTGKILDALAEAGVESGEFWPAFSADNIRSEVLVRLPELSWITVNMRGSLAEVIAVERKEAPELVFEGESADIVAEKGGFVTAVNALTGKAEVKVGSAVREGDILISGAVESSFAPPRFLRSYGSVTAETNTELMAAVPENENIKSYSNEKKRRFALVIGDNRINFYSGSSISGAFCDKIISIWKLEAAGLFSLPISLVCETEVSYETQSVPADSLEAKNSLEESLRQALALDLGDGEVLSEKLSFAADGGLAIGTLRVRCSEEIGVLRPISKERRLEIETKFNQKADDDIWQREG